MARRRHGQPHLTATCHTSQLGLSTSFGYRGVYFSQSLCRPRRLTFQKVFTKPRTFYRLISRHTQHTHKAWVTAFTRTHTTNNCRTHGRRQRIVRHLRHRHCVATTPPMVSLLYLSISEARMSCDPHGPNRQTDATARMKMRCEKRKKLATKC